MSEYQWVHFRAVDRPLNDDALRFMRTQSTRADVSRWEFTNEYNFGDFRGDADEMLRRGYDVHLHFANFRMRYLAFRLPELPCNKKTFKQFAVPDEVLWVADSKGSGGILWVTPECEDFDDYLDGLESMLDRIAPARNMLIRGDLRPLYLFWLATCYDEEAPEPPVPAGLAQLIDGTADDCLLAIAEFLEVRHDLIEAAASESPAAASTADTTAITQKWLLKQSKSKLCEIAAELLHEPVARNRYLSAARQEPGEAEWPANRTSRTWGDLVAIADAAEAVRVEQRRAARQAQLEKEKAAAQKARDAKLKQIADNPMALIRRIDECIAVKNRTGYEEATCHLKDLGDAIGIEAAQAEVDRLRRDYPKRSALYDELKRAGF